VQDLQAFLHDLTQALRQASRSSGDGGAGSTANSGTTTPIVVAGAVAPGATGAPVAANTGAAAYGQGGIIAALKSLVADLANSQELSNTDASSGLSSNTLSNLNSAFQKLIADLGGNATGADSSSSTSSSTSSSGTAGSTGSSASSASATGSSQSTAALQSFLTSFVQDLQNNGANSISALGSSVNTTA
jgi:hypothetical protein